MLTCVTHAALHILCLAIGETISLKALSFLNTGCSILHWLSFRTFCLCTQTPGLILTGSWLLLSTLYSLVHIFAVLAARRIAITTNSLWSKFAVFVTAHIYVILAYKSSITFFLSLNSLVTTVRLFGFSEATRGFCHQHSTDCSKTAWRESLPEKKKLQINVTLATNDYTEMHYLNALQRAIGYSVSQRHHEDQLFL